MPMNERNTWFLRGDGLEFGQYLMFTTPSRQMQRASHANLFGTAASIRASRSA